jgi:hypothetical protein
MQSNDALVPLRRPRPKAGDVDLEPVPKVVDDSPRLVRERDTLLCLGLDLREFLVRLVPRLAVDELALADAFGREYVWPTQRPSLARW